MRTTVFSAALFFSALASFSPVQADQTGMAGIHDHARYNGQLCFVSHSHTGSGSTASTKKAAMNSAITSWREFTAWEYGSDWAHWRIARGKSASCSGGGASWSCTVEAFPCLKPSRRSASRSR